MNLTITNLSKRFKEVQALDKINLDIKSGEFIALLGPSGCGKTTLLRLIAGFEQPTEGEIKLDQKIISNLKGMIPPEHRNMGMVFQSFALWPHMKVKDHIRFPLIHHSSTEKLKKTDIDKRIEEVLAIVGLKELANRMPHQLSGGQKQRVAFARAIAARPSLLLMDEPLSSLDAGLRMELRREIQNLHRLTNTAIIYVTHDQGEALAMADRIVVMRDGKIEQVGSPQQIYLEPATEFVATFVGKANLIHGSWKGNLFFPYLLNGEVYWESLNVSDELRNRDLFPARPEQFKMVKDGTGFKGVVKNVLYQGKEIHYTVQVGEQLWGIYNDNTIIYHVGESITLQLEDQKIAGLVRTKSS